MFGGTTDTRTEVTIDQVKAACRECEIRYDALHLLRAKRWRIEAQIGSTQLAVYEAQQAAIRKKEHFASVLGVGETDLTDLAALRAAVDFAEVELYDKKNERSVTRQAEKTIAEKIKEADKVLNEAFTAVRDLARKYFNTMFDRNRLFANNAEQEHTWRAGLLAAILNRLSVGDLRANLALLEMFLQGGKFTVRVQRGFWYGKASDDWRALQRDEELLIPKGLDYRMAFEELINGRLQLAGA